MHLDMASNFAQQIIGTKDVVLVSQAEVPLLDITPHKSQKVRTMRHLCRSERKRQKNKTGDCGATRQRETTARLATTTRDSPLTPPQKLKLFPKHGFPFWTKFINPFYDQLPLSWTPGARARWEEAVAPLASVTALTGRLQDGDVVFIPLMFAHFFASQPSDSGGSGGGGSGGGGGGGGPLGLMSQSFYDLEHNTREDEGSPRGKAWRIEESTRRWQQEHGEFLPEECCYTT